MLERYNHKEIEKKWQEKWQEESLYKNPSDLKGEKSYVLDMFPYPSGDGLHVGHPKGYIATDIYSRMKKMQGHDILHPMGWDAFGLPAENYAIKNKIHPQVAVEKNIKRFKEQLGKIGFNYDWDREINTTDPEYYKWTQWIFLKLLEKGLAYESYEPINWCPSCQTGLANEDLEDGKCERCGSEVEKKPMRQWVLKITDYADRLLEDLEELNWPEYIKESQRNWIGRSEGAEINFEIRGTINEERIKVFTTRADTLFGATYLVLAPEHPWLIEQITNNKSQITNKSEIEKYIEQTKNRTEIERIAEGKEKTGVEIKGVKTINPATKEEIPIWVADYVLPQYGTGAIMAVPSHDDRDFEFAKKYNLPIREVVSGGDISVEAFTGEGALINSGEFDGMKSKEARAKITQKFGQKAIKFKLKDWVFSRQRYWGEPIPVIHCDKCGVVPVSEKDLPVKLPDVENYEPTGTGESPLVNISDWVNTTCPKCGGKAKRETNTMPQWAGSCWYYIAYCISENLKSEAPISKQIQNPEIQNKLRYWLPINMYVGGAEHATRHLIYARFWHKFLFDLGLVNYSEPFSKLHNVGLILASDDKKMSKRYGNVINPDEVIEIWGADSLRLYEMFMGPFSDSISWNTDNMIGARRFLEKVWRIALELRSTSHETREKKNNSYLVSHNSGLDNLLHKTIKKVTKDIEAFKFNTAISAMMIFVNKLEHTSKSQEKPLTQENLESFLKLLAPFAPHITEEIWSHFAEASRDKSDEKKYSQSIHLQPWPEYDESKIQDEHVTIVVQVNGKVRAQFEAETGISENEAKEKALSLPEIQKWLSGSSPKKIIFVPDKLLNFVA